MGEYYVRETHVYQEDEAGEEVFICEASDFIAGAAEQIARALNRLPQAEELLVQAAQLAASPVDNANDFYALRREIEEWMIDGVS